MGTGEVRETDRMQEHQELLDEVCTAEQQLSSGEGLSHRKALERVLKRVRGIMGVEDGRNRTDSK